MEKRAAEQTSNRSVEDRLTLSELAEQRQNDLKTLVRSFSFDTVFSSVVAATFSAESAIEAVPRRLWLSEMLTLASRGVRQRAKRQVAVMKTAALDGDESAQAVARGCSTFRDIFPFSNTSIPPLDRDDVPPSLARLCTQLLYKLEMEARLVDHRERKTGPLMLAASPACAAWMSNAAHTALARLGVIAPIKTAYRLQNSFATMLERAPLGPMSLLPMLKFEHQLFVASIDNINIKNLHASLSDSNANGWMGEDLS